MKEIFPLFQDKGGFLGLKKRKLKFFDGGHCFVLENSTIVDLKFGALSWENDLPCGLHTNVHFIAKGKTNKTDWAEIYKTNQIIYNKSKSGSNHENCGN